MSVIVESETSEVQNLADLAAQIMEGKTDLATIRGLTTRDLEAVYTLGHGFFGSGDYASALSMFQFLTLHRQVEARYWFGLAASLQMLGRHALAVQSYAVCAMFNLDDPQVPLRAGECFLALGDKVNARSALEAVLVVAGENPRHAAHAARARLILGNLGTEEAAAAGGGTA